MSAHGTEDVSGLRAQVVQCLGKARIALNGQVVVFQGLRREEIDSQLQNDTHKIIYIYIHHKNSQFNVSRNTATPAPQNGVSK